MIPFPLATPGAAMRKRLLLFALSGAVALGVGFILVAPKQAEFLIRQGGYYYMLALFAGFVTYAIRVARARREAWQGWLLHPGWTGVALVVATLFTLWSDSYQHKVLFDEYVLQATGFHMHATKEVGTVIRAYDLDGTWLPIDTFLDKRPYFFTFLLSLVHDFTGYRIANIFVLNSLLAAAFLGLTYWFARELTGRAGGLLAVALLATMPLLGQNATSAGMEMHNLTMLILVMCLALLYLRVPGDDRLSLLCLGTVLLAQSRYESAIYVLPVAAIVLAGWWRARAVILPWVAVITPVLSLLSGLREMGFSSPVKILAREAAISTPPCQLSQTMPANTSRIVIRPWFCPCRYLDCTIAMRRRSRVRPPPRNTLSASTDTLWYAA